MLLFFGADWLMVLALLPSSHSNALYIYPIFTVSIFRISKFLLVKFHHAEHAQDRVDERQERFIRGISS